MHGNTILIVKAEDKEDAEELCEVFLEEYSRTVYDYYAIANNLDNDELPDVVTPLSECLDVVKSYVQTYRHAKEYEHRAAEWLSKHGVVTEYPGMYTYGQLLGIAADIYKGSFCFDTSVYNVTDYSYDLPENPEGYYAVVVDMHF